MSDHSEHTTSFSQFQEAIIRPQDWSLQTENISPPEEIELRKQFEILNEEIRAATPQKNFGAIEVSTARPEFARAFDAALTQSSVDTFIAETITRPSGVADYSAVYTIKAHPDTLSPGDQAKYHNHQPENLQECSNRLETIQQKLLTLLDAVPPELQKKYQVVVDEYTAGIQEQLDFCQSALFLSTPEYARLTEADRLANLLDRQQSTPDAIVFKHEKQALEILQKNLEAQQDSTSGNTQAQYATLQEAMDFWEFSSEQLESKGITHEHLLAPEFPAQQAKGLFELILAKVGMPGVVLIDESTRSISVNPRSTPIEIKIPATRRLTPDDCVFVATHELWHVTRGLNGGQQGFIFAKNGMTDYLKTEEGLAVLTELLAGEKFGHPRQVKMAARYYAGALAAKTTRNENGERSATYSMQEIYDSLREFAISEKDAKEIVWRLHRGTSLQRQVVEIPIDGETFYLPEANLKDTVYFEGQMEMFEKIVDHLPLSPADREKLERWQVRDVSNQLLARVGRMAFLGEATPDMAQEQLTLSQMRDLYNAFIALGREAVIACLNYYSVAKAPWEVVEDPRWQSLFTRDPDRLTDFGKLFETNSQD